MFRHIRHGHLQKLFRPHHPFQPVYYAGAIPVSLPVLQEHLILIPIQRNSPLPIAHRIFVFLAAKSIFHHHMAHLLIVRIHHMGKQQRHKYACPFFVQQFRGDNMAV